MHFIHFVQSIVLFVGPETDICVMCAHILVYVTQESLCNPLYVSVYAWGITFVPSSLKSFTSVDT